ncbi:alkaline phosphatase family protein [Lysinibacillus halotolerans]
MLRKILFTVVGIIVILGIFVLSLSMSKTKDIDDIEIQTNKKPVIFITVDSLMTESLQKAIDQGKAPALEFLIKNGTFYSDFVSSYPTMSVTIDSTILTGTYANEHRIPGLIWFNQKENRMISYGSGLAEIWNNGIRNVTKDSIIHLNNDHLNKEVLTIHEELDNRNLQSASINGLLFRGNERHLLNVPKMVTWLNLLPKNVEVVGPTLLSLGALSQLNPQNDRQKFLWDRMGVNNEFTVNELNYLIEQHKLPSFTLAYLPDADATLHRNGPDDLSAIEKADESLQKLLNNFSSWDKAIQEVTWIIMGDSAQSLVEKDKKKGLIDLNKLLNGYSFWDGDKRNGQIAIAINERMAYIYLNDDKLSIDEIVGKLKKDERIGFIAWKEADRNYVINPNQNDLLSFYPDGSFKDSYGQSWQLDGGLTVLDLNFDHEGTIQFNAYPDALARLHGALHSNPGRFIIVDAKPHYEFIEEHSHDHAGGGAHGSLHKIDSLVPMIIVGTNSKPESHRFVELKEWLVEIVEEANNS